MSDQLAPHEKTAFATLAAVLKDGRVERDSLRVLVASRGGDLGRDYIRLRDLWLVEEVEQRPGFFRRLFGAKPKRMVGLTPKGMALAAGAVAVGAAGEAAVDLVAEAAALPAVDTAPVGPALEDIRRSVDTGAATFAEDAPLPAVAQVAAPEAAAVPIAAEPAVEVPRPRPAPRFTPADFTEAVGGAPVDEGLSLPEGDRLDGLAELLALLGFELMPAGRLLAAQRWAEGFADADVALEVLVVSVAHAARLDRTGTAHLDRTAMLAVLEGVGGTLAQLVAEGALVAEQVDESLATMRIFLGGEAEGAVALEVLLNDPLRGLAPPALCPEGVWVPADTGED